MTEMLDLLFRVLCVGGALLAFVSFFAAVAADRFAQEFWAFLMTAGAVIAVICGIGVCIVRSI